MNDSPVTHARPQIPRDICRRSRAATILNHFKHGLAVRAPLPIAAFCPRRLDGALGILVYHRVTPRVPGVATPTWNVTPDKLRAQLVGLLARGYQAWPLRKALKFSQQGRAIPPGTFVVTFDDGYANNYHHALPVLQELKIPATIFLATAYLDGDSPFPFDDWEAAGSGAVERESWVPLTTSQCRAMLDSGLVELGAHTHTHADFRSCPDALVADLRVCLGMLRSRFGIRDATFAFPYGVKHLGFSGPVLAEAARRAGVLCSLTTENEPALVGSDPFDWGRFTAASVDTAATLSAKLDGWYNWVRHVTRLVLGRRCESATPRCLSASLRTETQLGQKHLYRCATKG